MMKYWRKVAIILVAILLVPLMPVSVSMSASALTESQLKMFSQNNIFFYDPSGGGCTMMAGGNNYNYDGDEVLSEVELQAIVANQPFYERAADEYGFPWQVLAAIHYREHRLRRDNPGNGQGAYQLFSYTAGGENENAFLPAGPISDEEFQRQTDITASLISSNYAEGLDLTTDEGVKKLFYRYNGTGNGVYARQALALGFSEAEAANGEGSPYVMNRFDLIRDPTVEPTRSNNTWGQFKVDAVGSLEYPANSDFGAFVVYVALGGSSVLCNGGQLVSGGFSSVEEADQAIMSYYREQAEAFQFADELELDGVYFRKLCVAGPLANCVSFTRWFIAKYTSAGALSLGNGNMVVGQLAGKYGFSEIQSEPRAYAIFSRQSGGDGYGHTGVVLGVDEAADRIIIGEAGCNAGVDWIGAHEEVLSTFRTSDYSYVYTDSILSGV